jgi:hypothetical protein
MTSRILSLVALVASADAVTYYSDQCSICWPSNRIAQCGSSGASPTNNQRSCGFLNWGCEYECFREGETTNYWSGCTFNWFGAGDHNCDGGHSAIQTAECGFLNGGRQYLCQRLCGNSICSPGYSRSGTCSGQWTNYGCNAIPSYTSPSADAQPPPYEEWLALGAQDSIPDAVASIVGDPHISFPHGGRADFRGADFVYYNFLSAKDLSVNVMTQLADFQLHPTNSSRHKQVHGSFLTQAHATARTNTGKIVRVSFWADKIGERNIGWANGTVDNEPVFTLGPKQSKSIDDVALKMTYASLSILTAEFEIIVTPYKFRLERSVVGLHHRLDVQIKLRVPEASMAVAPHGIVGQHWDGDGKAINGERDVFPTSGEFTTYAMAKGAIEGKADDYRMASKYATDFKFSRFNLKAAAARDVGRLVAAGELNAPTDGSSAAFVGSTEIFEDEE